MFCVPRLSRLVLILTSVCLCPLSVAAELSGRVAKWHPIQVDVIGPQASEVDISPNPFLDYRLSVEFKAPSGAITVVPGFFAGDGNGRGVGNVWRTRFSADELGVWQYAAELRAGRDVAVSLDKTAGSYVAIDGAMGTFEVSAAPDDAPSFLRHGRLEYVGSHYMKFRDGPYWIKGGTDSPENLLGFSGIDGTFDHGGVDVNFLHDFSAHRSDWNDTDPYFTHSTTGADSQGLIGAINYLGEKGVNSVYFLPMNLGGDGQETYPFVGAENTGFNKSHYDISKLFQWNIVLNHAQEKGVALNIVLSETEPANEQWLDNGEMGVERRLFFRELVARFGYLLAVKWNLGEENDFPRVELDKHADYLQAIDWSAKPIAVHTHINQFYRYGEIVGDPRYSASSIQYGPEFAGEFVEQWRRRSRESGHLWVIDMDENTDGLAPLDTSVRRKQILYDVLFSGGNIEWYFGYNPLPLGGDVNAGDFRQREVMWDQMRFAREMMQAELPFWRMEPQDSLLNADSDSFGGAEVFAARAEVYAVYLPATNGAEWLNLHGVDGVYQLRWFDPRSGQVTNGRTNIAGDSKVHLGMPPSQFGQDWVALVSRTDREINNDTSSSTDAIELLPEKNGPHFVNIPSPIVTIGETYQWVLSAKDTNGTNPSVTAASLPAGMQLNGYGNGQLEINWTVPEVMPSEVVIELIAIRAGDSSARTTMPMIIKAASIAGQLNSDEPDQDAPDDLVAVGFKPVLRFIPNMKVTIGQTLIHRVVADSLNGFPPSLNVWDSPDDAQFLDNGDGTRTFYWTPLPSDVGLRTLTFAATYGQNSDMLDTVSVEIQITP
jgi:hypothetical protein